MKNTVSIQDNNAMDYKIRGMYGSTVNEVDRSFGSRAHRAHALKTLNGRPKIHPGEAGVVSGRRIRVEISSIGRLFTLRGILLLLFSVVSVSAAVILMLFNFETAAIYGNTKYSPEQIESFITRGNLGENTFVMALKYHHRKVSDIPFIDQIDIDIVNPSTVRVNIIEKPTDGCISYKGNNVYFSKEGIIQTVSRRTVDNTTVINGVVLTHSNTGTQVLAKNQLGLDLSLELIRQADKYGIRPGSIDVDERSNLTAMFGDVKVMLGKTGFEHKMFRMHQILPYLEGRSGTISMTGFVSTHETDNNIVLSPYMTEVEAEEAARKAAEQAQKAAEEEVRREAEKVRKKEEEARKKEEKAKKKEEEKKAKEAKKAEEAKKAKEAEEKAKAQKTAEGQTASAEKPETAAAASEKKPANTNAQETTNVQEAADTREAANVQTQSEQQASPSEPQQNAQPDAAQTEEGITGIQGEAEPSQSAEAAGAAE